MDLCESYMVLLNAKYFQRVWVVQEYISSQRTPWVMIGHALCSFLALYEAANPLALLMEDPNLFTEEIRLTKSRVML